MRCLRRRRPAYAATVLRPVYESSFWTSKELQETSLNRRRISRLRNQKKKRRAACSERGVTESIAFGSRYRRRRIIRRSNESLMCLKERPQTPTD